MQKPGTRFFQRHFFAAAVIAGATAFAMSASAQVAGVENFHQVNDHIYRGAQPTDTVRKLLRIQGIQ